jgi:hypothetical protein
MNTYAKLFAYVCEHTANNSTVDTDYYDCGRNRHLYYNRNTFEFTLIHGRTGTIKRFLPDETVEESSVNSNGCVLYDGPSEWDGERIVVVLTGLTDASANDKTDDMLQTWILRADRKPTEARRDGSDESVCGDCPHRTGSCYVNLGQGPRAVWECWNAGRYLPYIPQIHSGFVRGRKLRIGSYGDPAMVPVVTFETVLSLSSGHTGYTHQWEKPIGADLRTICMASCDTEAQTFRAESNGWRYFYVSPDVNGLEGAHLCRASEEAGKKTNCAKCNLCNGAKDHKRLPSVFIPVHGTIAHKAIYSSRTSAALAAL